MTRTLEQQVVDLAVEVPLRDVLRMMGCGPGKPHEEVQAVAGRLLEESGPLLRPRGVYRICEVAGMSDHQLDLVGWPSFHGPIAGFLRPSRRVAVFVVTVGNGTQDLAEEKLKEGDVFEGYALHAIGAAAADRAADAMAEHVKRYEASESEDVTLPFSPGYCGMPLEEQRTLFTIVDGDAIGVKLWPTCIMEPVKSVSGLVGIGPAEQITDHGSPCRYCELDTCKMRR
ncbi:MAG: 5-methyltetrahydrofolate--homocysteine methyltransferase [Phycisphaerae bacterium]